MRFAIVTSSFSVLLIAVVSALAIAILYWDHPAKTSPKTSAPQPSIEIKWGEGSEAGVPAEAPRK